MNIATLVGVVIVIPAGQSYTIGDPQQANRVDWQQYSLHGGHAADLAAITGETVS